MLAETLAEQRSVWNDIYLKNRDYFGEGPSEFAKVAAIIFRQHRASRVLELGCGQGRDCLFLAHEGFEVETFDYAESAVETVKRKAEAHGQKDRLNVIVHDARTGLPYPSEHFDAAYSHMFFCMSFTTKEIENLFGEVWRVLKPGGLHLYSVRNKKDLWYGKGEHLGEQIYRVKGLVVYFFDQERLERFARGFRILNVGEGEETRKMLFLVTLQKGSV